MKHRFLVPLSVFISLAVILCIHLGTLYYERGKRKSSKMIEVMIEPGATMTDVEGSLKRSGLLRHPFIFRMAARLTGKEKVLKAGRYLFDGSESAADVLKKLSEGEVSYKRVVVPEGLIVKEVAGIVSGKLGVDSLAFYNLAFDSSFVKSLGIEAPSLEGYLFPDTYLFEWPVDERSVASRMVHRFLEVYSRYIGAAADSLGMSMNEVVTLASIVQAEAQYDSEMARISAVYHNRLKMGWRLEADPTVAYALGGARRALTYRDLRINSPYNTYRRRGLPPGPICNPGLKALEAAVRPLEDCRDLYFVADGTGRHIFTRTLEEHLKAKRVARLRRLAREREKEINAVEKNEVPVGAPEDSSSTPVILK